MARLKSPALRLPMQVWDLPTRLFHWLIVVLVAVSYASISLAGGNYAWIEVHFVTGYMALAAVLFRIAWGFVGSDTARFSSFVRGPLEGLRHLAHFRQPGPDDQVGHNAAGGWVVLTMLGLLLVQAGTGLFSNDDAATEGPLAKYVSGAASHQLTTIHAILFKVLLAVIVLHVAAVLAYAALKRHDLIRPMVSGKKRLLATTRAPRMASPLLAMIVLLLAAALVAVIATAV